MSEIAELAARIKRIEDREEIRALVGRYSIAVDNKDMEGMLAMFTPDGGFGSKDGLWQSRGTESVRALYEDRFETMPISNHFNHDHLIWFESDDVAKGHLNTHAEMIRDGEPMLVAVRYEDTYERHEGAWKFKDRITSFFYYMNTAEYLDRLKTRDRMCGGGPPRPADWPEGTATWQDYYAQAAE